MKRLRSKSAAVGVSAVLAAGVVVIASPTASAATVPNIFYCSQLTGHCRQQNGAYVSWVPSACHSVWTIYWSDYHFHGCSYWF